MDVILPIPDDLAARLGDAGAVSQRALEAFGLAEYLAGRLTRPELRHLLGLGTRAELDGFLKAHDVFEDTTLAELERDRQDLERVLGSAA